MKPRWYLLYSRCSVSVCSCMEGNGGMTVKVMVRDRAGDRLSDLAARPSNLLINSRHSPSTLWGEGCQKGSAASGELCSSLMNVNLSQMYSMLPVPPFPHCNPQEQPKF